MSDKQAIQVPGLKTIGPYSQAVRVTGLLFVSGQPGVDPSTGEAVGLTLTFKPGRLSGILIPFYGLEGVGSTWS